MMTGPGAVLILKIHQVLLDLAIPFRPVFSSDSQEAVADIEIGNEFFTTHRTKSSHKISFCQLGSCGAVHGRVLFATLGTSTCLLQGLRGLVELDSGSRAVRFELASLGVEIRAGITIYSLQDVLIHENTLGLGLGEPARGERRPDDWGPTTADVPAPIRLLIMLDLGHTFFQRSAKAFLRGFIRSLAVNFREEHCGKKCVDEWAKLPLNLRPCLSCDRKTLVRGFLHMGENKAERPIQRVAIGAPARRDAGSQKRQSYHRCVGNIIAAAFQTPLAARISSILSPSSIFSLNGNQPFQTPCLRRIQ